DKIMVTCGIDHIPPPLLQQLKPNGIMVIPVGPPGQHVILKIVKQQAPDGSIRVARSNVYNKVVPFVAFTKLVDDKIQGTHDGSPPPPPGDPAASPPLRSGGRARAPPLFLYSPRPAQCAGGALRRAPPRCVARC